MPIDWNILDWPADTWRFRGRARDGDQAGGPRVSFLALLLALLLAACRPPMNPSSSQHDTAGVAIGRNDEGMLIRFHDDSLETTCYAFSHGGLTCFLDEDLDHSKEPAR